MNRSKYFASLFGAMLFAVMLSLGGCGTTTPAKFYLLTPIAAPEASTSGGTSNLRLGLGPIDLPEYLQRPQIVTRMASTELRLAEDYRWAEPLEENFSRVLAENLSALLGSGRVHMFPWSPAQAIDYQVIVQVARFEADEGGKVSLVARWDIRGGNDRTLLASQRSDISVPVQSPGNYDSQVAASSTALAELSRAIAAAIKQQQRP